MTPVSVHIEINKISCVSPYRNTNADWFAGQLTLETLHTVLHKTGLPSDFRTPSPASEQYVDDTYSWVRQAYNGTKPLHHFALLVAVIASQLLPRLFMPKDVNKQIFKNASPTQVREIYGRMGWVSKGKKGQSDKTIFVTMITSFIIALYEPDSPLRQHILSADKNGLGNAWTKKNCKHCIFFLCAYIDCHVLPFEAVKGITYVLLIRLGVLWGRGVCAYEKGTFGDHYGCHTTRQIETLYRTLLQKIRGECFVPYDTLSFLIGHENAHVFCAENSFSSRHLVASSTSMDEEL